MIKKVLLLTSVTFVLSMFTISSCQNSTHENTSEVEQSEGGSVYQCPMECEEGKTYDHPGQCGSCGMDLEEVEVEE